MSGKGSSPRNLSKKFRDNYSLINWGKRSEPKQPKKSVKSKVFHIARALSDRIF